MSAYRWAVGWKHPVTKKTMFCFTFRSRRPDVIAVNDRTMCGEVVMFRIDSKKMRRPTCPDCRRRLSARTK